MCVSLYVRVYICVILKIKVEQHTKTEETQQQLAEKIACKDHKSLWFKIRVHAPNSVANKKPERKEKKAKTQKKKGANKKYPKSKRKQNNTNCINRRINCAGIESKCGS